jgi:hypothetical protein
MNQYAWHSLLCLFSTLRPPSTIIPHLSHLNRLAGVSSVARDHIYWIGCTRFDNTAQKKQITGDAKHIRA